MRLLDLLQSKQESASRLLATGSLECLPVAAESGYTPKVTVRAGQGCRLGRGARSQLLGVDEK